MEKQCDDVAFMRETLQKILKKEGDSCAGPAQNGAQLRSLLDKTIPDYLLLDIHLGTENGLDLLQEIQCRDLPTKVVMVTADNSKECIESDTSHGADLTLSSPLTKNILSYAGKTVVLTLSGRKILPTRRAGCVQQNC